MTINRSAIRKVAFGFLDTLIDVDTGMWETLERLIGGGRADLEAMAAAWHANLARRLTGAYAPWPRHVLDALYQEAKAFGVSLPIHEEEKVAEWVARWPFLPDYTALARLGRRFEFCLVTQLDSETLAACYPNLPRQPDRTSTSNMSRAYMPNPAFFKLWRVQLGVGDPERLLVVSVKSPEELEPAAELGYQTLHLDRSGGGGGGPRDLHDVVALLG